MQREAGAMKGHAGMPQIVKDERIGGGVRHTAHEHLDYSRKTNRAYTPGLLALRRLTLVEGFRERQGQNGSVNTRLRK